MVEHVINERLQPVSGEQQALMEVLRTSVPRVKWTWTLVATFERMLMKRGYRLVPLDDGRYTVD